jgi:adenylosuccinate synthase
MLDEYNKKPTTTTPIKYGGRILISDRAHVLFDFHKIIDGKREDSVKGTSSFIGTTRQGIGPCYSTKAARTNIRMGDLLYFDKVVPAKLRALVEAAKKSFGDFDYDIEKEIETYRKYAENLKPLIVDTVLYLNRAAKEGKKILIESANATRLDIDFGTYPYVTSSNPSIGGAFTGLGFPPQLVGRTIAIVKAYTTRVGEGPFLTEDHGKDGTMMREKGGEFGTTTGRPRRCGWLDLVQLKYCKMINGWSNIAITKLDILTGLAEIKVCTDYIGHGGKVLESYPAQLEAMEGAQAVWKTFKGWSEDLSPIRKFEDLPKAAQEYCLYVEKELECPVSWIGVGAERDAIITRF